MQVIFIKNKQYLKMKNSSFWLLLLLAMDTVFSLFGQTIISGTITDAQLDLDLGGNGNPMQEDWN